MANMTHPTQATPLFAATLTPYRSLSQQGLRNVVLLTSCLAAIPGLVFFSMGAWPIVGFLGLDVLAVYWALTRSMKDGKRREEVTLWPDELEIRRFSPQGKDSRETFNPFFVRLIVDRDDEDRTTALHLKSREKFIEIGSFLNPDDKASFAKVFGDALRRARG
jgi:uncharacterized membrane protein